MESLMEYFSSLEWWRITIGILGLSFIFFFLFALWREMNRRTEMYIDLASTLTGVPRIRIRREFRERMDTPVHKWIRPRILRLFRRKKQ